MFANEELECQHHANCGGYCESPEEREACLCGDCLDSDRAREQMEREHSDMQVALRRIAAAAGVAANSPCAIADAVCAKLSH